MTRAFLWMLAICLPAACTAAETDPFASALEHPGDRWLVRGQSPDFYSYVTTATPAPMPYMTASNPMIYQTSSPSVYAQGTVDPFATQGVYPAPITQDPWAGGPVPSYGYPGVPTQGMTTYGMTGARPRRYGWESRYDVWWAPSQGTNSPDSGNFEVLGVDVELALTENFPRGTSLTKITTPQFNYRSWQGPEIGVPEFVPDPAAIASPIDLPGAGYRFGLGLAMQTAPMGGWTYEVGFTPSLATDFRSEISLDSFFFDGHAVAYWQMTPQWMWAFGAQYWDRVDDIVIPYAGVVYTPTPLWEFRLLFPESRITTFLGTPFGLPMWAYVGLEYHVEAYDLKPKLFANSERTQFEDWRLTGGFRWETGPVTAFVEGGWIFDRNIEYDGAGSDFNIDDGFIGRIGFRY